MAIFESIVMALGLTVLFVLVCGCIAIILHSTFKTITLIDQIKSKIENEVMQDDTDNIVFGPWDENQTADSANNNK